LDHYSLKGANVWVQRLKGQVQSGKEKDPNKLVGMEWCASFPLATRRIDVLQWMLASPRSLQ